jgi:hypothetical protein
MEPVQTQFVPNYQNIVMLKIDQRQKSRTFEREIENHEKLSKVWPISFYIPFEIKTN